MAPTHLAGGCKSSTVVCRWTSLSTQLLCLPRIYNPFLAFYDYKPKQLTMCCPVRSPSSTGPVPIPVCAAVSVTCKICVWSTKIPDTTAIVMLLFRQAKPNKSSLKLHLVSIVRCLLSRVQCSTFCLPAGLQNNAMDSGWESFYSVGLNTKRK